MVIILQLEVVDRRSEILLLLVSGGHGVRALAEEPNAYLFCETPEACSYAAEMYTFFGACKVLGKNPKKWLAYVLDHIRDTKPKDMHRLLPSEWVEC